MCWPAIQSTHIPTRLKGHKKLDGRQQGSCHHRCTFVKSCSVAYIAVLVSYDPQEVEAERQQGGAQQVTQSCQVRNGKAVWIFAALPHGVHHPVCYAQQKQHLEDKERRVRPQLSKMNILQEIYMITQEGPLLSVRMGRNRAGTV